MRVELDSHTLSSLREGVELLRKEIEGVKVELSNLNSFFRMVEGWEDTEPYEEEVLEG